jgi:ATP phosphoribosyltransferase regulatory subunit
LCLPKDLQDWALFLLDLRGRPTDVIQRLTNLDLNPVQRTAVNNLKSLLELLQNSFTKQGERHGNPPAIVLDLSLLRTFDYYTGIIFEAVSGSSFGQRVLGQGGRYDQLLGLYNPIGETYPGIGFSLNTEEIHQVLLSIGQLPMQTPASNWLVVPTTPEAYVAAFAYAQKIRESTNLVRVEVDLGGQNTQAAIRDYARDRRISQIAWVDTEGLPKIEAL